MQPELVDFHRPREALRELREPMVNVTLLCPANDTGALIALCEDRAGAQIELSYLGGERALLRYRMPLGEIATEFHDRVKTLSSGFASVDYEEAGLEEADVVNLSLRVNQQPVDALSRIVRRSKAREMGKEMAEVLSKELDRQNHEVIIQAVADGTVVARQTMIQEPDGTMKYEGGSFKVVDPAARTVTAHDGKFTGTVKPGTLVGKFTPTAPNDSRWLPTTPDSFLRLQTHAVVV